VFSLKKYIDMIPNKPGAAVPKSDSVLDGEMTQPEPKRQDSNRNGPTRSESKRPEWNQRELKRHEGKHPELDKLSAILLDCYRSALLAMGEGGVRACPAVGSNLQQSLATLEHQLTAKVTTSLMAATEAQVEQELQQWGEHSAEYLKAKATEVKELLLMLARTAESIGERDQRYTSHFNKITAQLQTIADLEDLAQVRSSLVKQATELKTYVVQMEQDSKKSVAQLRAEVTTYETKLKAAEELAQHDSLTGLANRRNVEERIEWRIAHSQVFCVVMVDLDDFKQVNDTHGHPAGDDLLRQFSQELRTNIRSTDIVGRWGGDEFIIVLDSDLATAKSQIERVQKWALGEYAVQSLTNPNKPKVQVEASIGMVQWQAPQTMQELIALADAAMYQEKAPPKDTQS
jgi:diguanylate cyclase (GGDEF)-like protein